MYVEDSQVLSVSFLDVGQGDATLIETPNGFQVLVDAGPNTQVLRELGRVLGFFDRSIDLVLATHPDQDHIGGMPDVFARYEVATFMEPGIYSNNGAYEWLMKEVEREQSDWFVVKSTKSFVVDGVTFDVLFPDRDAKAFSANLGSVILKVSYGAHSFLLTGDSPKSIEKYLVSLYGDALQSAVVTAGHHGSKTSSDPIFVEAVRPLYSIVSAGKNNRYGHPHKDVLETYAKQKVEVLETSKEGTITFISDGNYLYRK